MLKYHSDLAPNVQQLVLAGLNDINPVPDHLTGGRLYESIDTAKEGRLSRTAEADNSQEFSGFDSKADVVESQHIARVDLGEVFDFKHERLLPFHHAGLIRKGPRENSKF